MSSKTNKPYLPPIKMKKRLPLHSTTLLLFFLVVFSCTKDDPIATKGNIYGKVTEEVTGQLISGAQVTVSGVQETTITSQNGSYQFSELPAGSYSVNVSKSGYVSDSKTLTVVPEKTTSGDFVLEKDLPTLSSNALIFNNETKTATLTLKNTRSGVMNFSVESSKPWLKPNPLSSAIQPLNEKIITVSVDFTNVPFGNYQEYIVINVGEASIPIPVQIDYIQPPYIEITKPTADQTYKMGEVMPVEWSSNLTGKVKIELYRFSSPFLTIATETLNNQGGNYTWTLPAIQQESYQIRISSVENEQIAEITGAFNILEGPTVPSVLTKNPIQNLSTSVQIPGEILNIGIQATEISQYGHVYSKNNPNPSIADQKTRLGSSAQEKTYVSEITNLEPGQTYYIAAYATNAKGTAYGDVLTITTNADVPVVETATILSIAENTAISGGTVAADGGSDILERGLCWGVNAPVTVDSNTLIDGSNTTGTFTTNLTGLSAATTYYIRAYAKNASGVGYGQQKSFTTNAGLPSIKTILAQAKGATDAVAEGEVLSNGGENLTSFGFVYALTTNPTIENNKIEVGEDVQGEYSYNLGNLIPQKTYYLRAYATNSIGTVYGAEKTFNTNEGAYFIINKPQESEKINVDQNYQIEWQSNLSSKRLLIEHFKGENLVRELSDNTYTYANNYKWYLPKNLEAADNNYIRILDYATLEEIGRSQVFEIGKHLAFLEPTNAQQVQPTAVTIKWESNYSTSLKFELYRGSSMITQISNGIEATAQQYTWNAAENFLPTATNYRIKMTDTQNNQFLFSDQFELLPAPPGVNTISNSQITHQSVFCEGSVYNDTGASIVDRGFVWAVTENPTLENAGNNKISLSSGAQNFQTTIYNLNRNTTYYLRAYATSSAGTGYGSQLVFKTLAQGVLLNTAAIRSITHDSAQCGGTISDDGGAEIIARGVCWSTNPDPTTTDLKTSDGKGLGSFSSQLTGLNLNTTYYVRAYAINEIETFYGQQQSFTSRDGMVDMSTNPVTSITINSALSGGTINDNGGSSITARGICWSTNSNPTIADSKTSNGTGTGTFTSQLTGLALSTTYYTRAYAINGLGTSYGAQQSFTTGNGSVSINTAEISDIQTTSAVSGGHVLEDGGATITARGVCWSTNPNPTIADDKTEEGSGLGSFTSQITDLTLDTTYYVRSYAINDVETTYGQEVSFKTKNSKLYLDDNGITVKAAHWTEIGDVGEINGVTYTVVDEEIMRQMVILEQDVSTICTTKITDMNQMFNGKDNFNQDISSWDVSSVTNMEYMFRGAEAFNQNIGEWDTSSLTNMYSMFSAADSFNQNIGSWDVSSVTDMNFMFAHTESFNQPLNDWDVSSVTDMNLMFVHTESFNQPLNDWDTSSVNDMSSMFSHAATFNQPLNDWDTSSVFNMQSMFSHAATFNQDLSSWDVANVIYSETLDEATPSWTLPKPNFVSPFYLSENGVTVKAKEGTFIGTKGLLNGVEYTLVNSNQLRNMIDNVDVTSVCTTKITDMTKMFENKNNFNQDISTWDVSNVTNMTEMFRGAYSFNQDISTWDVSNVTNMYLLFYTTNFFDQDIGNWDVSNVKNMSYLFGQSRFNQDIGNWDVSNVTDMGSMFHNNRYFNQDLSDWDVSNVENIFYFSRFTHNWTLPKPNFNFSDW